MNEREDRALGPEMTADGWRVIVGDWLLWMHVPSQRSVAVQGPFRKEQLIGIPALGDEVAEPLDHVYVVDCTRHDDMWNPAECSSFWTRSYAEAVRRGRAIRQAILDERPGVRLHEQTTLDDAVAMLRRTS